MNLNMIYSVNYSVDLTQEELEKIERHYDNIDVLRI